jgi:tetratricopeptide (TPR) repeat protein
MAGVAVLLVVAAAALAATTPAFRERLGYLTVSGRVDDPRFPMWRSTWELFAHAPVLGTGLGSFGRAIHLTQSPDCAQELWFAHSDPLNLLSDAGVAGFALAAWWVVAMLRRGLPSLRAADAGTRCLAAGALGAAAVVLVASLGDFQTQFAVVAIPFAALLTVPAALAAPPAAPAEAAPRATQAPARFAAAGCLVLAAAAACLPLAASARRARELREFGVTGATTAESLAARGRAALALVGSDGQRKALEDVGELARLAARADPLLDDAHLLTGYVALSLGAPLDDVLRAVGRARRVARGHADTNLRAGRLYLETIGTSPAPFGPEGDGAVAALREAGEISPQTFSAAWAAANEAGLPLDVLREMTPPRGNAVATLSDALLAAGRADEAIGVLRAQLTREPWDAAVAARLAAAYSGAGRESEGRSFFDSVGARWPSPR